MTSGKQNNYTHHTNSLSHNLGNKGVGNADPYFIDDDLFFTGDPFENDTEPHAKEKKIVTPSDLKLINKKIPIRYCEYKISNSASKMLNTECISCSNIGIMFQAPIVFIEGTLMRIWIDLPDYWARKSKHVAYKHTNAPQHFQILARVVACEDIGKRLPKFQLLCETVSLDKTDEVVLCEYLGLEYLPKKEPENTLRLEE